MYKLFNNKQIYEKDEVDNAIEGVVSTATNAYDKAEEAAAKADTALAETGRIEDAYNMAEQAFNKMDTYDTAINDTLTAAANATTLAMAASERSLDAKEKAELAYARVPIKYVDELPSQPQDMLYGMRNTTPVTESRTTTFVDIIGTYFRTQSAGKYVLKDEYELTVGGTSFGSVYVSKETVYCYTSRNFTGMLPTVYNTYDQYVFVITEQVDRMDYYAGNAISGTFTQLAGFDLVINGYIQRTEKGAPGGVATLDTEGHILYSQLPVNATVFRGTWDASTGEYPTEHVTPGDFFIVSVAGEVDGIQYLIDDRLYWTGEGWNVTHAPDGVVSINGKRGEVTLTAADLGAMSATNPSGTGRFSMNTTVPSAARSVTLGTGTASQCEDGVALGKYNYPDEHWQFAVGTGSTSTATRNGLALSDDGKLYCAEYKKALQPIQGYDELTEVEDGQARTVTGVQYVHHTIFDRNSTSDAYKYQLQRVYPNETLDVVLLNQPDDYYTIECVATPGNHTYDCYRINVANVSDTNITIRFKLYLDELYNLNDPSDYVDVTLSTELLKDAQYNFLIVGGRLCTLNVPNAIWN